MKAKRVDPWFTKEFRKDNSNDFEERYGKNVTIEREVEEQREMASRSLDFNMKNLKDLDSLGPEAYIESMILDIKNEIKRLENPTDEDKYMYTKEYFKDMLDRRKEDLLFYEGLYKDKANLDKNLEAFRLQTTKTINKLKQKLAKIEGLKDDEIDSLDFKGLLEFLKVDDPLSMELQRIEKLQSITPDKYMIPNTRLTNKMANGGIKKGNYDLVVSGQKKEEVITLVALSYDDKNIKIYNKEERFTPFHRAVYNAICSIYEAGNTHFTAKQVYRCMNGLDDSQYVSDVAEERITQYIDENRSIYAKIDYTQEAKNRKKGTSRFILDDYILSIKGVTLEAGGHEVKGYVINSKPILYEYAQISRQVITVPNKLLYTSQHLNTTPEVTIMKEYFIREIEWMKRPRSSRNNKVTFNKIYEEIGLENPPKKKAQKIRDNSTKILDSYIKDDYIKNYRLYKEGRSFKGIEIIY